MLKENQSNLRFRCLHPKSIFGNVNLYSSDKKGHCY